MAPNIRVPANFGIEHINSEVHGNLVLKLKDGQEIKTNSMIMSLNSPVIDNLTTSMFQSALEMDDFTKPAVDCFVEAMYSGEVDKLEKGIFEDVNKMAHVFDVSWLTKRCIKFYKTDVLQFENNSYNEILFACEIASRAHYILKQSYYVRLFVSNIASREISKTIFLQRYMADFAELSKRQIDMSLAVAGNDCNLIMITLVSHVTKTLKCKDLDENSIYVLQHFNVDKLRQNFPIDFNAMANLLTEVTDVIESSEAKGIVKNVVETSCGDASYSSTDDVEGIETTMDCDESDFEENAEVGSQTDYNEVEHDWSQPVHSKDYSFLDGGSVQLITTDNMLQGDIWLRYALSGQGGSKVKQFAVRCENVELSRWSYFIAGCNIGNFNTHFLKDVPLDKVKNWIITKTSTHLKIVCNSVIVLSFNFAVDCDSNKRNGEELWSLKAKSFTFYPYCEYLTSNQMLVRNLTC